MAAKPKYCKTKFGTIFGPIYMYKLTRSSFQGLSDDVLIVMLYAVVHELLAISSIDDCVESKICAVGTRIGYVRYQ